MKIIKVQLSQFSSDHGYSDQTMLIYNKHKLIHYEASTTEEVRSLMNGRAKAYFKYELDKENKIIIGKEVNKQNW